MFNNIYTAMILIQKCVIYYFTRLGRSSFQSCVSSAKESTCRGMHIKIRMQSRSLLSEFFSLHFCCCYCCQFPLNASFPLNLIKDFLKPCCLIKREKKYKYIIHLYFFLYFYVIISDAVKNKTLSTGRNWFVKIDFHPPPIQTHRHKINK